MVAGEMVADQIIADLESAIEDSSSELLTIGDAAQRSGYSVHHLSRLVRDGTIPNAGRKGAPRVRLGDLPARPSRASTRAGALTESGPKRYDPATDARNLLSRNGGHNAPNEAA